MIKLVLGAKGKGKTKYLLDSANAEVKESNGVVIYLDKNSEHMFQLDRNIRLINVREYPIADVNVLLGFVCGLAAGNNDIESIYFDSFLSLATLEKSEAETAIDELIVLSDRLGVNFTVSVSMDAEELPEKFKDLIVLAL